ncbi:SPOR domain-containing protein [Pontixanthobacter luteolus]|uniref:SPOR domain-containing protein n=1 Tax=Pontixanthobacter luteolus TaxID=295089 RepID=UPI00230446ED|nr:SPOR domain-containing protein [Pontixanthobacter luteolus]
MKFKSALNCLAAAAAIMLAAPATAELNAGYEAWHKGDYTRAVAEWRDLAAAGNADAQYNMAQAYRQGKGVKKNEKQAEILLAKAAAQGHIKATDNYGLLLFQSGRREEAMPYVTAASQRGNPWAQYLIGIGHFNGDLLEKDWVKAYALMTLSNSANYEHAKAALAQMDDFIPLDQRQQAQLLAQKLKRDADAKFASQKAAEDLSIAAAEPATSRPANVNVAVSGQPLPSSANRIPRPVQAVTLPPSVAAAQAAVAEASRVTGTESPANAGADFTPSTSRNPVRAARAPATQAQPPSAPASAEPRPKPAQQAAPSADGPWRVQLGAFGVRGNADKLWSRLSANAALSGKRKLIVPAGNLVRLQAGGFATQSQAQAACNTLKRSGQNCLVTR